MKSFKDFNKSISTIKIVPAYASTFAELRNKGNIKESISIGEAKELSDEDYRVKSRIHYPDEEIDPESNPVIGYHALHDRDDVRPRGLTEAHKKALHHYIQTGSHDPDGHNSSGNINAYLRGTPIFGGHDPKDVKKAVDNLNSAFTKKNTNKIPLDVYSGVPRHVGEALLRGSKELDGTNKPERGAKHKFSGFTSVSSYFHTAHTFAKSYHEKEDANKKPEDLVHHVVKFRAKPGTLLSVVHQSPYPENESIMQPNTFTHLGHERERMPDGSTLIVHHMTHSGLFG